MMTRHEIESALRAVREAIEGSDAQVGRSTVEGDREAEAALLRVLAVHDSAEGLSVVRLTRVLSEDELREVIGEALFGVLPQYVITSLVADVNDERVNAVSRITLGLEWEMT